MKPRLKPVSLVTTRFKIRPTLVSTIVGLVLTSIVGSLTFIYLNTGHPEDAVAAPTDISGIINSYLRVTGFNQGNRRFTANNLSGNIADFQAGRKIMVYQAKGATISTVNNNSYGTVTSLNNAGNYEFAVVESITSSFGTYTITVSSLENTYTAAGAVQLVSVPQYEDASVVGTVTAIPWNASEGHGGIVAFEVANELTLGADINVSGLGFSGAQTAGSDGSCPNSTTYTSNNNDYAAKGEGITTGGNNYAKGPRGNGGGGGNPHNAGGGGGSNLTTGGFGGRGYQPGGDCANRDAGGMAGRKFDYMSFSNKVFLGGGGGAGQQNDGRASDGANGGGIVVVRARSLRSTCSGVYGFIADGSSAANSTGNDGAGGGGAGGTIVLDIMNMAPTCNVIARANGGNGGTVSNNAAHGGGGGGGIGVIMETYATTSPNMTIQSAPGVNGRDCNVASCTSSGTAPETPSTYKISVARIPGAVITLPVELVSFTGHAEEEGVSLEWVTSSEINNSHFDVERSSDGVNFIKFASVEGVGNSSTIQRYAHLDKNFHLGGTYYRLKQVDFDNKFEYSKVVYVPTQHISRDVNIYPNPATNVVNIVQSEDSPMVVKFVNMNGVVVQSHAVDGNAIELDIAGLQEGSYIVDIISPSRKRTHKLVVQR